MHLRKKLEDLYFKVLHSINTTSFGFKELSINEIPKENQLFANIFNSKESGIIIKNFLSADEIKTFFKNMEMYKDELTLWRETHFGTALGGGLQDADPNMKKYFQNAPKLKQEINKLFGFDIDSRIISAFQKLSDGLPVEIAKLSENEQFAGCNLRIFNVQGEGLPEHVGLGFFDDHAPLKSLEVMVDISGQLSFFIPLQLPQAGGHLRLYDLMYEDMPDTLKQLGKDGYFTVQRFVRQRKTQLIKPGAGDLLIFNGGHIWHRITKTYGPIPRITVGGFANFSTDRSKIMIWS